MRIFIVVAKHRRELYEYFAAGFAGFEGVDVILDRRMGRESPPPAAGANEPFGNRRLALDIYDELATRGFVIVRVPA